MLQREFVAKNKGTWQGLSALLDRAKGSGLSSLSAEQLHDLGQLYRRASAHLSQARSAGFDRQLRDYLNQLAGRAYARIYAARPTRRFSLSRLFVEEIPQIFRKRAAYIAAAFAIFLVGMVGSYVAVRADERWACALATDRSVNIWRTSTETESPPGEYFARTARAAGAANFAALLATNNIQVALRAFAFGMLLGLGTVFLLLVNGAMLGTFFAVGASAGKLWFVTAVVGPHGVTELSAVFIAAAAGLLLGHAIVDPGDLFRRDALRIAARDAVKLVVGTVPMFAVAAFIEAYVSPQTEGLFAGELPRVLFGLLVGLVFWLYLFFGDTLFGSGHAVALDTPPDIRRSRVIT